MAIRIGSVLLLLLALPAEALVTGPAGPAPCGDIADLQGCILGVAPGEVIEIAADAIPAQSIAIIPGRSFTLRPAPGFQPVFAGYSSISAAGGASDVTVVIEGLTLASGRIRAVQAGLGRFEVAIRGNAILGTASLGAAIEVSSGNPQPPYGATLFAVEDNRIEIVDPGSTVSSISVGAFQGAGNVARSATTSSSNGAAARRRRSGSPTEAPRSTSTSSATRSRARTSTPASRSPSSRAPAARSPG